MDSSERSNLPVMMTSDSARTTSARAAEEVRIVLIFPDVRKTGLMMDPMTSMTASAGRSARSRSRAKAMLLVRCATMLRWAAGAGTELSLNSNPLDGRDEFVIAPTRRMLGDDLAMPHHKHPVADPQILKLAARHQNRSALAARIFDCVQERFFRFHIDASGRINQNENRRAA